MAKMTYEESTESLDARIEQLRARRRNIAEAEAQLADEDEPAALPVGSE